MRNLFLFLLGLVTMPTSIHASEPIVFVSAFTAGEEGAIHAYHFDSQSGQLKLLQRTTDVENPFFLAISPDQRFLYAIDAKEFGGQEDEFVAAYAIEADTGTLRRLNRQSARGTASCYLAVDASGKSVLVANYSSGTVAALPVRDDGSLGSAASFVQHGDGSDDAQGQNGAKAHCFVISPDNRFALAADLGIDKILNYRLDAATALLAPNEAQPFVQLPPGSGPRHLTFHPHGQRVYVINELNSTVTFFDYATDSGALTQRQTISTLPDDFSGKSFTADVKITPDGKFLYGTNRGHDSIAVFRIADDGQLQRVGIEPSLGKGPQNLLITPDGRWLMCANMPGNSLVVFAIDATTGSLQATAEPISIPMPSCIRWLE
ncbi:MAG: lactonase family protein [Pirellulaceae bacterium]|nr:lactonase family protein [Pirellulaceae bacterium]